MFTFEFSLPSSTMTATNDSLSKFLTDNHIVIETQDNIIRSLKAACVSKLEIDTTIKTLNALKLEKTFIERSLIDGFDTREAFK